MKIIVIRFSLKNRQKKLNIDNPGVESTCVGSEKKV